jgi:hypothetical protein
MAGLVWQTWNGEPGMASLESGNQCQSQREVVERRG